MRLALGFVLFFSTALAYSVEKRSVTDHVTKLADAVCKKFDAKAVAGAPHAPKNEAECKTQLTAIVRAVKENEKKFVDIVKSDACLQGLKDKNFMDAMASMWTECNYQSMELDK